MEYSLHLQVCASHKKSRDVLGSTPNAAICYDLQKIVGLHETSG